MSGTNRTTATPFDAICFDLDDTLYPYEAYARSGLDAAADRLAERTGERHHDELFALYFDEGVTTGTFDTLLARHDLDPDLAGELVEAYHGASDPLDPYPETHEVLSRLEERHRLALITDGRGGHAKLERLGIGDYFGVILVNHSLGLTKHEAEPFERTLDELGVTATRAVYVGDDPRVDFLVPNRLGMGTVRVRQGRYTELTPSNGEATPDTEIPRLRDLLTLIDDNHHRVETPDRE